MSASFNLTLDTHAPLVTWGAVSGTTAGELLQVGYQLDEPELVSAELVLRDGRHLTMTDTGLTLEVALPPDTPNGNATIVAHVRDEVLNEADRQVVVALVGTVVIPEPESEPQTPGWPVRPRRPQPTPAQTKTVRSRTRLRPSAATRIGTYSPQPTTAIASSSTRTGAAAASRAGWHLEARARTTSSAKVSRDSTLELSSRATVGRRDGPSIEALLLDLL